MKSQQIKPVRVRWQVLPLPGVIGWAVIRDNTEVSRSFFKYRAVNFAVKQCNFEYEEQGVCSELLVYGRGRGSLGQAAFQEARSYGAAPREIKG